MKTRKPTLIILISLIIALLLLYGCSSTPTLAPTQAPTQEPSLLTLTFSGEACSLSGPKSITFGKFTVKIMVEGQGNAKYGFVLVTLDEGKTLEDLQAWPSTDPPDWLDAILFDTSNIFGPGTTKNEIDLSSNAAYKGKPIYFVCFTSNPVRKIGAVGPVESDQ